jgi:hypothetical protein
MGIERDFGRIGAQLYCRERKFSEDAMRFARMMLYVNEAFHAMQNGRLIEAEKNGFVKMPEGEKDAIAGRLKTDFKYQKIKARHDQVFNKHNDAIESVASRKGKKSLINIKHAQAGFDINPREFILDKGVEIYPRGLIHFIFGSLEPKSGETPMRFIMNERQLEWIDTEAASGEKGCDLKYKSKEQDLFKDVTLTTGGFSMTAGAVKVAENGDTVTSSIWD